MQPEILRVKEVTKIVGLSRTTVWRFVKSGDFPKPLQLGGEGSRCVGWYRTDIEAWLHNRPRKTEQPQAA